MFDYFWNSWHSIFISALGAGEEFWEVIKFSEEPESGMKFKNTRLKKSSVKDSMTRNMSKHAQDRSDGLKNLIPSE